MSETAFDIDKIARGLEHSDNRCRVVGWVAAKIIDEPFFGAEISQSLVLGASTVHYQLKYLEGLELIARDELLQTPVNTYHSPLKKVDSPLWVPVSGLLIKHGIELPSLQTTH